MPVVIVPLLEGLLIHKLTSYDDQDRFNLLVPWTTVCRVLSKVPLSGQGHNSTIVQGCLPPSGDLLRG